MRPWCVAICVAVMIQTAAWRVVAVAQSGEAPARQSRVLKFPADRVMGLIFWRKGPPTENDRLWMYGDEWRKVAEARGEVRLPSDGQVRFDLNKAASADLSGLDQLDPETIEVLNCRDGDVSNEGLAHIGRLVGLRMLNLQSTPITDVGGKQLAGLKKLQFINLEAFAVNKKGFGVGDATMKVLSELPELERVWLRDTKVTDAGVAELCKAKTITDLDLSGTAVSDVGLLYLKPLPRLENLRLGVYREGAKITDEGLKTVGEMTRLKFLDLSGTKITNDGLLHLKELKRLTRLCLEDTKVTEAGLENLEPLTALEDLRLYLGRSVTDVGAEHLSKLKSLRRVTDNMELTDKGVAALARLPNLEQLELFGDRVTDDAVRSAGQVKSLKWLDFQHCAITDDGLAALADMPNLELFRLYETRVTGSGLLYLQNSPKLTLLGIDFGRRADLQPDLQPVAQLQQVERLEIGGVGVQVGDLKYVTGLRRLKELELKFSIDDEAVQQLSELRNLTSMTIQSSAISDAGLKRLSSCRNLQYLWINGNFTDDGLAELAELRSLQNLSIGSPNIT